MAALRPAPDPGVRQLHRPRLDLCRPADHPEGIPPRAGAGRAAALRILLDLRPHADPRRLLIDKFGPRKVVTASCIGWGAATAASGLAGGFLSMFIARLGIGVAEAGVMPAGGKLNAIWMHKKERGRGATILDAGAPLGAGLGGILITWLIAATGSWRYSFIIAGAATVLMGLAVWWYVRDNPRTTRPSTTPRPSTSRPPTPRKTPRPRRMASRAARPAPLPEIPLLLGHVLWLARLQRRLLRPADLGPAVPGPGQALRPEHHRLVHLRDLRRRLRRRDPGRHHRRQVACTGPRPTWSCAPCWASPASW